MSLAGDLVAAGPGLVRLAAGVSWRVSTWAMHSSVSAASRLLRAAVEGESVATVTSEVVEIARDQARELLGFGGNARAREAPHREVHDRIHSAEHLRRRGEQLLAASADVHYVERNHPAYDRILDDLAPDEARILRLLHLQGPQPSVDVRTTGTPVVQVGSELIAPGLSMIGAHAGVRYVDRVQSYLNNLHRLGLVWFSREPIPDLLRYQVLEAQPDVGEALRRARRGKTIRRSIHLTPFGEDFCRVCIVPVDPPEGTDSAATPTAARGTTPN